MSLGGSCGQSSVFLLVSFGQQTCGPWEVEVLRAGYCILLLCQTHPLKAYPPIPSEKKLFRGKSMLLSKMWWSS